MLWKSDLYKCYPFQISDLYKFCPFQIWWLSNVILKVEFERVKGLSYVEESLDADLE